MKPISFKEANCTAGANHPEYQPLPLFLQEGEQGNAISCWELSPEEIERVKETGKIYVAQFTFNQSVTPILLATTIEEVKI